MSLKPICVPCGLFFTPDKNGQVVEEGKPHGGSEKERYPGWTSYKLWRGDQWKCRGCGATIIVGVASVNFAEHYQSDYELVRQRYGGDDIPFVHDC